MILCARSLLLLCTLIGVSLVPFEHGKNVVCPIVAAEVLPNSPWNQRFLSRTRDTKETTKDSKNAVPTNVPTAAPTPAPTKKAKNGSDASDFVGAAGGKDVTGAKPGAPSAAPTIPKEPRQATEPVFIFPPILLFPSAPMVAPTPVATPTVTTTPVATPTVPTTPAPVVAPIAPAPIAVPTGIPTPVANTTLPPTLPPTAVPVNVTMAPTSTPTVPPVSEAPSDAPTSLPSAFPSSAPSSMPSDVPTLQPSDAPSSQPTIALDEVSETVGILLITYPNVPLLNESEIGQLEQLTEAWFEEYYNSDEGFFFMDRNQTDSSSSNETNSTAVPRRFLRLEERFLQDESLASSMIRNMSTIMSVQNQNLSADGLSNIVSYNQLLMYRIVPGSNETAKSVAIAPFRNVPANKEYQTRLMSEIPAFADVGDIEPPKLGQAALPTAPPAPAPTAPTAPVSTEKETLSSGAIAGIAVGGLIILGLVGYAFIILPNELKAQNAAPPSSVAEVPAESTDVAAKDGGPASDFPTDALAAPSTAGVAAAGSGAGAAAAAGVAVGATGMAVGAAAFNKHNDEDTSTLGGFSDKDDGGASYAGKSVDTSDFDYSKVGHSTLASGSQLTSAVEDVSKHTKDDLDEDQFVIYAPAGKLGLVVDNPDDGPPVVHAIKEDSVLIDQVQVGDRLIGVDEVDVRQLSPVKVSKLISKRSTNPLRKLTLTRGKPYLDDEETADGGDTTSQVESQMETDTQSESMGAAALPRRNARAESDDETSHVGSMSHLSGEEDQESVMDYPDDGSSVIEAMSHTSGGVAATTATGEVKDTVAGNAETTVGEETAEAPTKKNLDP